VSTWAARVHRVRVPFRVPFETAAGSWVARESWLLRVEHEDGRVGWGEAVLEDRRDVPVLEALFDELITAGLPPSPALVGRAGAAGRAFRAALDGARLGMTAPRPEAGVTGLPAAGLPSVGVNATSGAGSTEAAVEGAGRAIAAGFRTLKLKAARDETTAALVERLGAVRAAVGDGVALRLDVNGTWDPETAVERLRALEPLGLQYVEQPLDPGSIGEAAALRTLVRVRIAADEAVASVAAALAVLEAGAADVLVVKPGRVGGPVAVAEIALMAADRGVPVIVSSLFETGIGLAVALGCAASLPDTPGWPAAERDHGLATADLLEDDLLTRPLLVEGGRMRAPGGPGSGASGVAVDEAAVARYAVDQA
jgi:L-alanine-DL-glutamate epimerase-like enolase superfamily enzyme